MHRLVRFMWYWVWVVLTVTLCAQDGIYADFTTSLGTFTCELDHVRSPQAAGNFIGLATGARPWMDQATGEVRSWPFFDGLTFHRVIRGFMIQSGSPNGQGTDGPGYAFPDSFDSSLRHDGNGILSMANSGPNSNGSQFFITVAPTPWLDNVHTVFGRVIQGYEVVRAISEVDIDDQDRPREPVRLSSVRIRRVGAVAEAFDIHSQLLPVVRGCGLGLARGDGGVTVSFDRGLYADLRLRESTDLMDWTSTSLGIGLEPSNQGAIERANEGVARFFALTRVQYASSTFAPQRIANRKLTLDLDNEAGTLVLELDDAGGGQYRLGADEGSITSFSWVQEPYRGRFTLFTSGLVPLVLRLDFAGLITGTFVGTAYGSPAFDVSGHFTLTSP